MSKVRFILRVGQNTYHGSKVLTTLREWHRHYKAAIGSVPPELAKTPKWRRVQWVFEHLPDMGTELRLFIFRESKHTRPRRSKYILLRGEWRTGVLQKNKRQVKNGQVKAAKFEIPQLKYPLLEPDVDV